MNINKKDSEQLIKISRSLREQIVNISYKTKAHHIGSELACIDILVALYFSIMKINPENPKLDSRDWFLLSKGHALGAFYSILINQKLVSKQKLINLKKRGEIGGQLDIFKLPYFPINFNSG